MKPEAPRILTKPYSALTLFLALFVGFAAIVGAAAPRDALVQSRGVNVLGSLCVAILVAKWIETDRKVLGQAPLFDEGFFIYIAGPAYLPFYLLATRGRRGISSVLGLLGLFVLSTLPAVVIFAARRLFVR